ANVVEPFIGALLLRRYFRREMTQLGALACFLLCAVVLGPMVGGAIGASVSALHGTEDPGALVALKWWIGDGLGVLVVATPVLAWAERWRQRVDPPTSLTETGVVTALVGALPGVRGRAPRVHRVPPSRLGRAAGWGPARGHRRSRDGADHQLGCCDRTGGFHVPLDHRPRSGAPPRAALHRSRTLVDVDPR